MKKTTIALAALAFSGAVLAGGPDPMVAPAPAAQDNMYIGFHMDMTNNFANAKFDSAGSGGYSDYTLFNQFGAQVGMNFGDITAEASLDYKSTRLSPQNFDSQPLLQAYLKGAYNFNLGHGVAIYPVAGIGFAHALKPDDRSTNLDSNTVFSYLLGAGVKMDLSQKFSLAFEYNWVEAGFKGERVKDTGSNVGSLRFNYSF